MRVSRDRFASARIRWVLACIAGGLLVGLVSVAGCAAIGDCQLNSGILKQTSYCLLGLMAVPQSVVIRDRVRPALWLFATGYMGTALTIMFVNLGYLFIGFLAAPLAGLAIGAIQAFVLTRDRMAWSRWVAASVLAVAIISPFFGNMDWVPPLVTIGNGALNWEIRWTVAGLTYGLVMAPALPFLGLPRNEVEGAKQSSIGSEIERR